MHMPVVARSIDPSSVVAEAHALLAATTDLDEVEKIATSLGAVEAHMQTAGLYQPEELQSVIEVRKAASARLEEPAAPIVEADKEYTKLVGTALLNAKGFIDYGIKHGLTTEAAVRYTVAERQKVAKALVDGGMSRRKAAKVLGVSHKTVNDDVGNKASKSGSKDSTRQRLGQSDQNDWRTPRKFLEAARSVMGEIDLDPASSAEANETVKASTFYTEADNGLEKPWKGRVWLNPPYGGDARLFVERLLREYQVGNVTTACLLVNSHPTETKWFQVLFAHPICFVHGRIDFGGPSREVSTTSTHGSAIAYLGEHEAKFAEVFSEFGAVVKRMGK
jgi:phage N-6-adenine-methyltransferase